MIVVRCGFSRSVIVVKSTVRFALASSPTCFAPNGAHSLPRGRAFLALLGEVFDEAIDLAVRCAAARRQITAVLTDALATKLHADPGTEYRLEWIPTRAPPYQFFLQTGPLTHLEDSPKNSWAPLISRLAVGFLLPLKESVAGRRRFSGSSRDPVPITADSSSGDRHPVPITADSSSGDRHPVPITVESSSGDRHPVPITAECRLQWSL